MTSTTLRLDGDRYRNGVLDGSTLAPGSTHTLTARAVLTRAGSSTARRVSLTFRSCPSP